MVQHHRITSLMKFRINSTRLFWIWIILKVHLSTSVSYLIEFGVQGAAELHVLHQIGALSLIRGDDANLVRFGSSLQQPCGNFLYVGSLSPWKHQQNLNTVVLSTGKLHLKGVEIMFMVPQFCTHPQALWKKQQWLVWCLRNFCCTLSWRIKLINNNCTS